MWHTRLKKKKKLVTSPNTPPEKSAGKQRAGTVSPEQSSNDFSSCASVEVVDGDHVSESEIEDWFWLEAFPVEVSAIGMSEDLFSLCDNGDDDMEFWRAIFVRAEGDLTELI